MFAVAAGAALVTLGILALATRGPPLPPKFDLSNDLARAFDDVASGKLKLGPSSKVSATVIAAGGVPERNAPSFRPRLIDPVGAALFQAMERPAVIVLYRADPEGAFAVESVQARPDEVSLDAGTIEHLGRVFTTFLRPGPRGAALHGVGQSMAGRMVFVVGTQPMEKLAELAAMIPQP